MAVGELGLIAEWSRFLGVQGLSPKTRRDYRYWLYRFLAETVPESCVDVTEGDVTRFLDDLGRLPAKRAAVYGLRSFFEWCERRGLVVENPTRWIRPKSPKPIEPEAWEGDEMVRVLIAAAWRDPRRAWTLLLCYALGTRRSELVAVKPEDIRDEEVMLRVTKTGRPRRIEIGPLAREALVELRPWMNGTVLGGIHPQTVTAWAHEAARDAGLSSKSWHRSAHIFRATFVTKLLEEGVPPHVVSKMVGHQSLAVTTRYAAVRDKDRRRAVNLL